MTMEDCDKCQRRHDEPIPAMTPGRDYIVTYFGGLAGNRRRVDCEYIGLEPDDEFVGKTFYTFRMLGPVVDIVTGVIHSSGLDPETGRYESMKGTMLGLWHEDVASVVAL